MLYCYLLCLLVLSLLYWFTVVCLCSVFIIRPLCAGQWGTTIIGVAAGELEWCSTSVLLFLVSFYVRSMCFMSIDCIIRVLVCIVWLSYSNGGLRVLPQLRIRYLNSSLYLFPQLGIRHLNSSLHLFHRLGIRYLNSSLYLFPQLGNQIFEQ